MTGTASGAPKARTNWAGNLTYGASRVIAPASVAEAQDAVRAADRIRAVGSRHCFNDIADTQAIHLSLEKLNRVIAIDGAKKQVTVEGGIRYGELGPQLHAAGFALHNLASLPHISIAGATATATHGSGAMLGSLSTAIAGIEFIDAKGDLVALNRAKDPDTFPGAVVNLGALGVVTKLTLDVEPTFSVRQDLFEDLPVAALDSDFDAIMGSGYSVSLFTDWQGDTVEQVWIKSRVKDGESFKSRIEFFGARPAGRKLHPIGHLDAIHCTEQMGDLGPSYDRLPHFKMGFTPASGAELQVEYFVPRKHGPAVAKLLCGWGDEFRGLLMISEVRTIAADDLWMSPYYKEACIAFHFSFEMDWPRLSGVLPRLEAALAPYAPRPHWGKIFTMQPATIQARYPRLDDFRALVARHDPKGKFRNAYLERNIFGRS